MRFGVVSVLVVEMLLLALAVSAATTGAIGFGFREAKALDRPASFVAGKTTAVYCAPTDRAWRAFLAVAKDPGLVASGSTVPSSSDTRLSARVCRTLEGALRGERRRLDDLAMSILTLVHESFHMRGEWNEGQADCDAFRAMPRIAVDFFHVGLGDGLRTLMARTRALRDREPLWYRTYC